MTATSDRLLVTPEHVEIHLRPGGLGSRFLALVTDAAFALALSSLLALALRPLLPPGFAFGVWATLNFVLTWGYHVYFESRHEGQSPGKRLVGLRVVDGRGLPVSAQQSFVRNVLRALDAAPIFYGLGALVSQLDRQRRRLGDFAADTLVIRERRTAIPEAVAARSQPYNSLRVPRVLRLLRHRVSVEEREFLLSLCLRADHLDGQARFQLFEEVAAVYRQKLAIEDPGLSGENLVRGVTALLFWDRRGGGRARAGKRR